MASTWSGQISFGLISVPIRLFAAARYSHLAFHEIHKECGTRVHQQLYCPHDERVVSRDEIVMGYEIEKDKYIIVEPEELKALQPKSSTEMEIVQFVKLSEIDPIYYETSYFAVATEAGTKAYGLLLKTMEEMKYAAIAQVTMHQRERTVVIRPYRSGLIVHTIYYPNEIHDVKGFGKNSGGPVKKQEIQLADQFAKTLVKPFRPEQFHDEYQQRVKQLVESKGKGKSAPKRENPTKKAPVIDMMTALKRSLAGSGSKTTASASKASSTTKNKKLKKAG
jgi:DNA end-binding protein Ku